MNDYQFYKRWEAVKKKGRIHYALTQGAKYGVFLTVFVNLMKVLKGLSFSEAFLSVRIFVEWFIFTLFGIVMFATFMWWLNNYFFNKVKR